MRHIYGPLRAVSLVFRLGLVFIAPMILAFLSGNWIDGLLGTVPIFTLLCAFFGISAGMVAAHRLITGKFLYAAKMEKRNYD